MEPLKRAKVYYHPDSMDLRIAENSWQDHLAKGFGWKFIGYL